jgi:hypothetical protein
VTDNEKRSSLLANEIFLGEPNLPFKFEGGSLPEGNPWLLANISSKLHSTQGKNSPAYFVEEWERKNVEQYWTGLMIELQNKVFGLQGTKVRSSLYGK